MYASGRAKTSIHFRPPHLDGRGLARAVSESQAFQLLVAVPAGTSSPLVLFESPGRLSIGPWGGLLWGETSGLPDTRRWNGLGIETLDAHLSGQ
jgi:hypothetical protein